MITRLVRTALLFCVVSPLPAAAQTARVDTATAVAAADRAAADAERAATAAQAASAAAADAARDARVSANQLRAALGLSSLPATEVAAALAAPAPVPRSADADAPPADENMAVTRPGAAAGAGSTLAVGSARAEATDRLATSIANGPNGSALKTSAAPDIQLTAGSEDKVASLAWTIDISRQRNPGVLSADQLTVTATGALDDDGNATLFGLRGYPGGSGITLAYTHYNSAIRLSGDEKKPVTVARNNCLAREGKSPAAASKCDPYSYSTGVSTFVAKYNPEGQKALLDEIFPGPIWFYGLSATGNQVNFKYLDRNAFKTMKVGRFSYGGSVYGGVILPGGTTAITGAFDYKRSFKAQDDVSLCQPLTGSNLTQCITSADGPPDSASSKIVSLEIRHGFRLGTGSIPLIAFAPTFSYATGDDAYSIDVPIYLATDGYGKLRGGIRGTYLNEPRMGGGRKGGFETSLFVGVPFDVFSR